MAGREVRGFEGNPRTAVNDIEQWQAATFDEKTIDEEFGWAKKIGFNSVRVFYRIPCGSLMRRALANASPAFWVSQDDMD